MPAERDFLDILSGRRRGVAASVTRASLSAVEPAYAAVTRLRNTLFDRGLKTSVALGRATISVGNLTTGGTGKTPVVQWIARRLLDSGHRPAVLLRGYRAKDGLSDEAELYRQMDGVEVQADPDRVAGAATVLARAPQVDTFLLDDAFQHRRAQRHFDLVLIDATNPFGHGHVLPRGLLREPAAGLRRADAILVTHADDRDDRLQIDLRKLNPTAPIYRCRHAVRCLIDADGNAVDLATLGPVAAVAGIGNPAAFFTSLEQGLRLKLPFRIALADHQAYDASLVATINEWTDGRHGEVRAVVVTEKDWTKLRQHAGKLRLPPLRAVLELDFDDGHAAGLWTQIDGVLVPSPGTPGEG